MSKGIVIVSADAQERHVFFVKSNEETTCLSAEHGSEGQEKT